MLDLIDDLKLAQGVKERLEANERRILAKIINGDLVFKGGPGFDDAKLSSQKKIQALAEMIILAAKLPVPLVRLDKAEGIVLMDVMPEMAEGSGVACLPKALRSDCQEHLRLLTLPGGSQLG